MPSFDEVRTRILAFFPDLITYAQNAKAAETERRLVSERDQLADGKLVVVVCGEFKRGKSALLNALLNEPGLFPQDDYYATSLVSMISYGDTEEVSVILAGDSGGSVTKPITRAELGGYVTESGNPENKKRVELVTIRSPNPRLRSGLAFVDTPGVGGVYIRHTMATLKFLPLAHAIVFVVDATQVLTESELHFLRRAADSARVTGDLDGLVCVLNKVDLVSDYGTLLTNTRTKLAQVMGRSPDQVTIVPVSSKAKLRYLARGDERYLRDSNFAELDRLVWATLARRQAKVLLGGALTELERDAQALLAPVEAELAVLSADAADRAAELATAQQKRQHRLAQLHERSPGWERDLKNHLADLTRSVRREADSELDRVWARFRSDYLYRDDFLRDPDRLAHRTDEDFSVVIGTASKLLSKRAATLQREFAKKVGFDLGSSSVSGLPDPPVSRLRVRGRLEDEPAGSPTPSGTSGASGAAIAAGAVAGATLGTMLLPGVGTVVGGILGGIAGGVASLFGRKARQGTSYTTASSPAPRPRQDVTALRRSIEDQFAPLEKEQRQHLREAVEAVAAEFSDAVLEELDSCVSQERESLEEAVTRATKASEQSEQTARKRRAELARDRVPMDEVLNSVQTLAADIRQLSDAAGAS